MKPRILVLSLFAAFGSACTAPTPPRTTLHVEPVLAVRHGVQSAQSYYELGRYYHGQRRLGPAEEAYLKAIAADERHRDAFNALGSLYAERGELERAAQMFEKVTADAPEAAYLHNNLGFAYYLLARMDAAYNSLRQALSLDATLQRAWSNLERIAGSYADGKLVDAVKARRLDALPLSLPALPIAGEVAAPGKEAALPSEAPSGTEAVAQTAAPDKPAEAAGSLPAASESVPVAGTSADQRPRVNEAAGTPRAEPIAVAGHEVGESSLPDRGLPVCPVLESDVAQPRSPAMIEVSNGNGVTGFARSFSAYLKSNDIPVARVTNHGSFAFRNTVVEFQPGYESAACSLIARIGLEARLVAAIRTRPRSDVRIVLGRDALPAHPVGKT